MTPPRSAYLRGIRHALPFIIVIVPFAMLFGVLASEAGLNLLNTEYGTGGASNPWKATAQLIVTPYL